jgi:hypothetical protein
MLGTSIYLFDRTSGEVIGRIGGLATPVQDLVWSPDGTRLLAALYYDYDYYHEHKSIENGKTIVAGGIHLYDVRARREIAADQVGYISNERVLVGFDRAGRVVAQRGEDIQLYSPDLVPLVGLDNKENGRMKSVFRLAARRTMPSARARSWQARR